MLKMLQAELRKLWTNDFYSKEFNASPSIYKDFDHALKHVDKAHAMMILMTEEADHQGSGTSFDRSLIEKYLADLIITTVRLAQVAPGGQIDLEQAVLDRIEKKMGVKLSK